MRHRNWLCMNHPCPVGPVTNERATKELRCPVCQQWMLPVREEPITNEERESWGFPV